MISYKRNPAQTPSQTFPSTNHSNMQNVLSSHLIKPDPMITIRTDDIIVRWTADRIGQRVCNLQN
jgi:hypothetical protein